jgi:3-isopropylmalate dehydrogenase
MRQLSLQVARKPLNEERIWRMKLLVLRGDAIGPEIVGAALEVLKAADARFGLSLDLEEAPVGLEALEQCGNTMPDETLEKVFASNGVILGPQDNVAYPPVEAGGRNISATIRKQLDLFANIRPSRGRPGVPALAPDIDIVIVRENTEGFYADRSMAVGSGEFMPTEDLALAVRKITREGSRRIAEEACRIAAARSGKLAIVHKANVLKLTDGLFCDTARAVAEAHGGLQVEEFLVDAMAALLVRKPEAFDVIVTTNMFGDILSDLAAELSGGLGLGPSINAGAHNAIAQAAHGSAPDIAGRDIANPAAMILSVAMLLDWLGLKHGRDDLRQAADAMDRAVDTLLADPDGRTPDLGGSLGTAAFGAGVAARLG